MITLNQFRLKAVIIFDSPASVDAIRTFFLNTTLPKLEDAVTARVQNNFTDRVIVKKLKVQKEGNTFNVYPKIVFSGDTNLTRAQLEAGLDNVLDDMKAVIRADAITRGVTNIKWHIQKTAGAVDETE